MMSPSFTRRVGKKVACYGLSAKPTSGRSETRVGLASPYLGMRAKCSPSLSSIKRQCPKTMSDLLEQRGLHGRAIVALPVEQRAVSIPAHARQKEQFDRSLLQSRDVYG